MVFGYSQFEIKNERKCEIRPFLSKWQFLSQVSDVKKIEDDAF